MKVFTATLGTETNTFSPIPTGMAAFEHTLLLHAGQRLEQPALPAGPLWAARRRAQEKGWQVVEGLCAFAMPGGITTRATYEALRDELLRDLRAAMPVDMVLLGMHGAMVADGYDDCEGDILARVRDIVGPKTVIGAELDPHCHLSEAMLTHADALICFKEYPHTDFIERGAELVDLCAAAAEGRVRPVSAVFDCRMIAAYHTPREPMRSFVDKIKSLEGKNGILSISVAHGFPWADVPDMGTKVLVIVDGDRAKAAALAEELGHELIGSRGRTAPPYLTIDQALDRASAAPAGPVVIADTADNAGGGAPSDSTFILQRVLERGLSDVGLAPLWDPVAVGFCFDAGEGARLELRIGGKTGPMSGPPLDLAVRVTRLGLQLRQSFGAATAPVGDAAAVTIEHPNSRNVELVLNTARTQATGLELFTGLGIDPTRKRIVVVKSSQHFHAAYAPIAKQVLYVGGPGAISSDLTSLAFRRIRRPKWPFDPDLFGPQP